MLGSVPSTPPRSDRPDDNPAAAATTPDADLDGEAGNSTPNASNSTPNEGGSIPNAGGSIPNARGERGPAPPEPGPRAGAPWLIAGTLAIVLLALASRYGYHRDELYFLLCGRNLAWGFVDQPPFSPLVARLADLVAPHSLLALRTPSALTAAGCVLLVVAITREIGGGRAAQTLAAVLAATSGATFAAGHLLTTTLFDVAFWLGALWLTIRMLRTGNPRWALAIGVVLGVGALNKYLVGLLAIGLVAGLLIAGPRRLLLNRWVLAGAVVAVLIALPNLIWQISHDFPELHVAQDISGGDSSYSGRLNAVVYQLVLISPVALPIWIAGVVTLLRRPAWRVYRSLAWAWIVVFGLIVLAGGKPYYDIALLLMLTGVGSVATVDWWARGRTAVRKSLLAFGIVLCAMVNAVLLLPTLPADRLPAAVVAINYDAGETIGWPAFTDSIAAVYRGLPADQRDRAVILTNNYGEAGALSYYGPSRNLPSVYSGHNSMADFGSPPPGKDVVVAVGWDDSAELRTWFTDVRRAGTVDERVDVDNDENGGPIWVCIGLRQPWSTLWNADIRRTG